MRNHKTFNNLILENETKDKEIYSIDSDGTLPSRAIQMHTLTICPCIYSI